MQGYEPERPAGGHPVLAVEAGEVYRPRKCSQRAFAAKVEIDVKVAESEFAQGAIHRLPVTASGVVGFRQGTPVIAYPIDGNDMVGIFLGFEVDDESRVPVG